MSGKYGRVAEDVAGLALGTVVYFNGNESRKVLESLANPYGTTALGFSWRNRAMADSVATHAFFVRGT